MKTAILEIEPRTKTTKPSYIKWFREIGIENVPTVGGKTASLGEMFRDLTPKGVKVPDGFAITAQAYRDFLRKAGLDKKNDDLWRGLDSKNLAGLLVEQKIDSISLNPDTVIKTTAAILEKEQR